MRNQNTRNYLSYFFVAAVPLLLLLAYNFANLLEASAKNTSNLPNELTPELPNACNSFVPTLGNWWNATNIMLAEHHDFHINTLQCLLALMNLFMPTNNAPANTAISNPTSIEVYFEGSGILSKDELFRLIDARKQLNPFEKLYKEICEKATTCGSWDDIDSYKKGSEVKHDSIRVMILVNILSSISQSSLSDKNALEILHARLADTFFDAIKDKPFYPIFKHINDEIVRNIISEQETAKQRPQPKLIKKIITKKLQLLQKKYPTCMNIGHEQLSACFQQLLSQEINSPEKRDNKLFQHINNKKRTAHEMKFFSAGANHIVSAEKMLEDKNELEGVAILTQRQALIKLKRI